MTPVQSWLTCIGACLGFGACLGLISGATAWRRWLSGSMAGAALLTPFWIGQGTVLRAAVALELLWFCIKVLGLARERSSRPAQFRVLQVLVLHDLRQDGYVRRGAQPELRPGLLLEACGWALCAAAALWLALFHAPRLEPAWHWLLRCTSGLAFAYTGVEGALSLFEFVYRAAGLRPPILHQRPIASLSVGEFWGRRWNRIVGSWLFSTFYRPLASRGQPARGLVAAFVASALLHLYFTWAAIGLQPAWRMASFFLLQLPPLWLERRWQQASWPAPLRWLWTLGWLVLTSPLFIEPMLDILAGGFAP